MATINWPSALPQTFKLDSYQEEMIKNVVVSEFEVGPSGLRRRVTANVFMVSGEMFMTTDEWEDMQAFLTEETLDRSLCFGFPEQGATSDSPIGEWLVFMDKPPSRSWLAEDFWLVTTSFVVLPEGLEPGTLLASYYTDTDAFYTPVVSQVTQVLTYETYVADTSNLTTYTFTAADIGTAAADRLVVVACHAGSIGGTALSSATIAGNTAAIDIQAASNGAMVAIISLPVPTSATADIVLTWNSACVRCSIGIFTITVLNSTTVSDTFSDNANGDTTRTGTLSVLDGGCVIAAVTNNFGAAAHSWTGANESYDLVAEGGGDTYSAGEIGPLSAVDPYTVTVTSAQTVDVSLVAAVWS